MATTSKWTESSSDAPVTLSLSEHVSGHAVQCYASEDYLTDAMSEFIGAGLGAGEACVVIATPTHRAGLEQCLQARGLDVAAAQARGDYVALDAAETLRKLLVVGTPDAARFAQVVGGVIERAARAPQGRRGRRRRVRAFGEMVALLWAAGDQASVIQLEDLWNDLQQRTPDPSFSLLCAYPTPAIAGAENGTRFAEVCASHSQVLPDESYSALNSAEDRLRAIALLQQRAASLEAEIAERRQTEQVLAEQNAVLERIAAGCPLDECLAEVTQAVARLSPHARAVVLLADESRATVAAVSAAELPPSFAARLTEAPITDLATGPCGTVIQSGQSVTCADVALEERWSPMWRDWWVAHGILACHVEPVPGSDGAPLAALVLGFDTPRAPSDWEWRIAHFGTHVASIAIERERAAQALRASEERLAAVFHSTAVGVAVLTPSMRFLQVNDAFCSIVGAAREGLTAGMDYAALTHPDDLPVFQNQMEALLAGRIPTFVLEVRLRRKDGALTWVQHSISLARSAAGQPLHLVALCQDITERKRVEAASAHLAAIVTSAEDAIASKTLDSIVTSWNASAERMFGYAAAEMIGQPITRLFPPDRLSEEDLILARIRAGERIEHFETVRVTKDGRHLDVSLTISPIRDSAGTIIGASKIVRDISERKRLEREVRLQASMLERAHDAIFMWELGGPIVFWNRGAELLYGFTRTEALGRVSHDLLQTQRSSTAREFEEELARAGEWTGELIHTARDGRALVVMSRHQLLVEPDGRRYVLETSRDITDQRTAEDALRQANARMDEFLHTVTHELKTPVTALQANVQLVERRLQRLLAAPPRTARAMAEALQGPVQLLARNQQQVRRLTRLVDDLVDAARIQAGKLEILSAPCDLAEIVWEAVTEQRAVRPERTIHLTSAVPEGQPLPVEADADRVGQVLTNYLTNALKYSSEASPVEVALRVAGDVACVSVRDHGPGIPAEEQARVWDRGHRVPGIEASGEGVGLGLGLHISREIVERHGGQVGVESVVGEGSTFWFSIPLRHVL